MLGETATAILDEYCELTGLQCSSVITVIVLEDLRKRLACVRHFYEMNTFTYSPTSNDPPEKHGKAKTQTSQEKQDPIARRLRPTKSNLRGSRSKPRTSIAFFQSSSGSA